MCINAWKAGFTIKGALRDYLVHAERSGLKLALDSEWPDGGIWLWYTREGSRFVVREHASFPSKDCCYLSIYPEGKAKAFAPVRQFLKSIEAQEMYGPPMNLTFRQKLEYWYYVRHFGEPWER